MGKKYIIELLDDCQSEFKGIMVFGLAQEKQISVELIPEESLTPYTEDSAYAHGYTEAESKYREIRHELEKRAYQRGYEAGYDDGYNEPGKNQQKAYEQEKEDIQVGNEVITASGKAVVTGVGPVHFEYDYADGSHGYDEVKNVKKTGRHFPEIAEVFEKMRGE